jgi:hypothetical protein
MPTTPFESYSAHGEFTVQAMQWQTPSNEALIPSPEGRDLQDLIPVGLPKNCKPWVYTRFCRTSTSTKMVRNTVLNIEMFDEFSHGAGVLIMTDGDWLVIMPSGDLARMKNEDFQALFLCDEPEDESIVQHSPDGYRFR